jgi:hypothetical protein
MRKLIWLTTVLFLVGVEFNPVSGAEPGWSPVIIATGHYRDQIRAMPIETRPYRPFHFYGNAVRRRYYRGSAMPLPRDISQTAGQGLGWLMNPGD